MSSSTDCNGRYEDVIGNDGVIVPEDTEAFDMETVRLRDIDVLPSISVVGVTTEGLSVDRIVNSVMLRRLSSTVEFESLVSES